MIGIQIMDLLYSAEAMISRQGKFYKGRLDFYTDHCILQSESRVLSEFSYERQDLKCITGKMKVSILDLYVKEKSFIQLASNGKFSDKFMMEASKIAEAEEKMKENSRNIPQTKEVIRKNCKNISPQKVIEPINKVEKSSQSLQPLQPLQLPFSEADKTFAVPEYNENALSFFLDNPYRILGIAVNSTSAQADDVLSKIKRLDRLHALHSYRPEFQLSGFKDPERSLSKCQNAAAELRTITWKWFWFLDAGWCRNWQNSGNEELVPGDCYDSFLAEYLYLLVFDPKLADRTKWHKVFGFYQEIAGNKEKTENKENAGGIAESGGRTTTGNKEYVGENAGENVPDILKSRFCPAELSKYDEETILSDFIQHIWNPLNKILDTAEITSLIDFYRTLWTDKYPALKEYKRTISGRIAQWFTGQEKKIWDQIESYIGIGKLDQAAADHVAESACSYDEAVQPVIENALSALNREQIRSEMIRQSYKKVMEKCMILLCAGDRKAQASKYGKYLYPYMDTEGKIKILAACGVEYFPEFRNDLQELIEAGRKLIRHPQSHTKDFKDITICKSGGGRPRMDFCGLIFKADTLGVKFWISNRTSETLKFWMMEIRINGEDVGSIKQICTMEPEYFHYYIYTLELPKGLDYSEVKEIEFYVEIDKPENQTIYDTNLIKIECDTEEETLYAETEEREE